MESAARGTAKVLGIKLDYRSEPDVSGGASIASVETCEYHECHSVAIANQRQTLSLNRLRKNGLHNSSPPQVPRGVTLEVFSRFWIGYSTIT